MLLDCQILSNYQMFQIFRALTLGRRSPGEHKMVRTFIGVLPKSAHYTQAQTLPQTKPVCHLDNHLETGEITYCRS